MLEFLASSLLFALIYYLIAVSGDYKWDRKEKKFKNIYDPYKWDEEKNDKKKK